MDLHPAMGAKITLGLSRTLAERLRFTNEQLRSSSDYTTRLLILIGLVLALVVAFFAARILLVPLIAALFLVYVFEPAVIQLQRRNLSASTAFLLLLSLSILVLGTFLTFVPSWLRMEDSGEIQSVISSPEGGDSELTARLET